MSLILSTRNSLISTNWPDLASSTSFAGKGPGGGASRPPVSATSSASSGFVLSSASPDEAIELTGPNESRGVGKDHDRDDEAGIVGGVDNPTPDCNGTEDSNDAAGMAPNGQLQAEVRAEADPRTLRSTVNSKSIRWPPH